MNLTGQLIMLCGVPGCGKTTFAQQMKQKQLNIKVISCDSIRDTIVTDDRFLFSREQQVKKIYYNAIKIGLFKNNIVVADAPHLKSKTRQQILQNVGILKSNVTITAIFFDVPLNICLNRNAIRCGKKRISDDTIVRMFHSQQKPTISMERYLYRVIVLNKDFDIISQESNTLMTIK